MVIADRPESMLGNALGGMDFDPYLYRVEMPLSAEFFPLGFPVRVRTNSAEVLAAAEESWGSFAREFRTPTIQMNVGVQQQDATECPAAPGCRARRHLMLRIADPDNFYIADLMQGYSLVWLTSAAVAHRSYLRYHFLESAALCHIANRYSAPVHAGCVERHGRGVLLCGDSGAGKSSLSFACARAGWTYITDDASFVLHARENRRVVGNCHTVRFRPSAANLFAEVAGRPVTPRAVGKPSIELATASVAEMRTANSAQIDFVVFLNRGDTNVREVTPFARDTARRYIHKHLCGMEELRAQQLASVERLLTAEVVELRYRDLDWATARLERLVEGGRL
jgi:hypothetical protein